MSLCPSKRARDVILDDDDTDDAVAFEPGVNIAALVFSKIQCVRTRAALARASKFWQEVSKQKRPCPAGSTSPCARTSPPNDRTGWDVVRAIPVTWDETSLSTYRPKLLNLLDNDEALSLPKERVLELMPLHVKTGRNLCCFAAEQVV